MSASNWRPCPQCLKWAIGNKEENRRMAEESYGKVGEAKYHEMRRVADMPLELEDTLREDYHQGVDLHGLYTVGYKASCQTCDYSFSYKYNEQTSVGVQK